MILNILISVSLFSKIGFIIIPIATSISTWVGVIIYLYLLNLKKSLLIEKAINNKFYKNIDLYDYYVINFALCFRKFCTLLRYSYDYKAVYLILIVSFVGILYLISCYLLGVLKLKNYKTN